MQFVIKNSKHIPVILKNIKALREHKHIKVEDIAKQIGISKGEYSKLENNMKPTLEKYFIKIANVLEVEPFDLALENCLANYINQTLPLEERKKSKNYNQEENERIMKLLEERDAEKNERIIEYKDNIENWKTKYYRMKERLQKLELKYNKLVGRFFKKYEQKVSVLPKEKPYGSKGGEIL